MKKQIFLKAAAVMALFLFSNLKMLAQPGNFVFTNNTSTALFVYLTADYDDCAGTALCSAGPVLVTAGNSFTFTGVCTVNGAWKFMKVYDACNGAVVGYCGYPTTDAFTDCGSNTVNLNWIDEHTGEANP